jgi:hypothetical protein
VDSSSVPGAANSRKIVVRVHRSEQDRLSPNRGDIGQAVAAERDRGRDIGSTLPRP